MSWAACCANKQMQDMFFGESSNMMYKDAAKGRREASCQVTLSQCQISEMVSCLSACSLHVCMQSRNVPSRTCTQTEICFWRHGLTPNMLFNTHTSFTIHTHACHHRAALASFFTFPVVNHAENHSVPEPALFIVLPLSSSNAYLSLSH
jgi:hypothetical protein